MAELRHCCESMTRQGSARGAAPGCRLPNATPGSTPSNVEGSIPERTKSHPNSRPAPGEPLAYDFDDSDGLAISTALPNTDNDRADGWYAYPLVGVRPVEIRLARDVEADEVTGIADDRTRESIELLLTVFARYEVDAGGTDRRGVGA